MRYTSLAVLAFTGFTFGSTIAADTAPSAYAGMERREIKALSSADIADYRGGKGMGFAKAAELNHYPGPTHVLALATQLGLTSEQRAQTEVLFRAMETEAVPLGRQVIDRERELDELFATKTITRDSLKRSLETIAILQGRLRQVHLQTHLSQVAILNSEQIRKYDELRGYMQNASSGAEGHVHRH
jgi:hypothetical protein